MINDESTNSVEQFVEEEWTPYCDHEYVATYVKLPRFLKVFRGKLQQIFGRRLYAFSRFSMTVGEALVFIVSLVAMGGYVALCYGQEKPSGGAAQVPLIGCLVFTVKNSILGFLVGISYERGIFWHKVFGVVSVAAGVLHMVSSDNNIGGWVLLSSMFSMVAFSFYPIRIYFHAVFMKLHWIGFLVFIVGSIWHGVALGIIGAGYWAADLLVKLLVIDRHRKNSAEIQLSKVSNDIVRLRVSNTTIPFAGGQFVFVCIPKISYFEWHPFSIQTSFKEGRIDLFVKVSGSWTRDVMALINESAPGKSGKIIVKARGYLSGPYGFPSIDIAGDQYKSFLLVGGGIGVTPIISICKDLLEQRKQGRPISKIILVWTTREMVIADKLMSLEYLESILSESDLKDNVFEMCIHSSSKDSEQEKNPQSPLLNSVVKIIKNRPDIGAHMKKISSTSSQNGEKRAAVMVCGPHTLITSVQSKACSASNKDFQFDVHEEVFAM